MILATGLSVLALVALSSVSAAETPTGSASAPGTWNSLVRINAGGGAFVDSRGLQWAADEYATGGEAHSVTADIGGTKDPQLFRSERWGMTGYDVPIPNGSYVLKLYFAEINPSSGPRVMSVANGPTPLLTGFDVASKAGSFAADVETFNVSVNDGHLPLKFSSTSNSASVAGIEILQENALSVYRMNAGGESYRDTRGLIWNADQDETGAVGSASASTDDIADTDDLPLYQSQQWGMGGYDIPIADGTYVLKLYFAETNPSSGTRLFDVYNGPTALLTNFNIAAKVGVNKADVEQFVVKVSDGHLALSFVKHQNEPSIAGIELLSPVTDIPAVVSTVASSIAPSVASPITPAPPASTPTETPSMAGWHVVASDDFSGSSIDTSKWGVYSGAGNEGVGTRSASELKVANGELDILGQGNTGGGASFNYSSTYGRYVIKARDDAGTGYGPALLLWPDSGRWPQDGEIDISEMPEGARTQSHFTVHYGANNSQIGQSTPGDFTQWHTWTVEWEPDHITVWIDGVKESSVTNAAAIPHDSMHLAVQNDVGAAGHWIPGRTSSTPATVALRIASVQAYAEAS